MKRTILVYGLAIATAASLLQWLQYRYAVRVFSTEIFIGSIAVLFTLLGIAAKEAEGMGAFELRALSADMEALKERYANPWVRMSMTFLEIFPVGLLISLISALVLRNTRLMPAVQPR